MVCFKHPDSEFVAQPRRHCGWTARALIWALGAARHGVLVQVITMPIGAAFALHGALLAWPHLAFIWRVFVAVALTINIITQVALSIALAYTWLMQRAQPDAHPPGVSPAQHEAMKKLIKGLMK